MNKRLQIALILIGGISAYCLSFYLGHHPEIAKLDKVNETNWYGALSQLIGLLLVGTIVVAVSWNKWLVLTFTLFAASLNSELIQDIRGKNFTFNSEDFINPVFTIAIIIYAAYIWRTKKPS